MFFILIRDNFTKECIQRDWIIVLYRIKWRKTEMSPRSNS